MSTDTASVELVGEETAGNVARAALLAALTGAFAYVSFPNPLSPAPVSLQVLGVFLAGLLLGPVWGGVSMALYLAAGAVGAPVFAGGSAGLAVLWIQPTSGYLWSYPVAAFVVGAIAHGGLRLRDSVPRSVPRLVGAMVVGTAVIYAVGVVVMSFVLDMTLRTAFLAGAAAFIPAEAFKIAAAVGVVRSDQIVAE
ncbi:biotin transporter BioY [Halorussus gelatinilyticus]|uniref:Biotin transporter BioY n=1 Tax=Halorussus gelatinilyticus TaxID=2937524 RepID=A0A8U0INK1_9EURY|nr:biotin transporter BioY [Halorussus gelatinilyticus]UPW01744.1 biotin transporter BioY [Halorussus gelatinilyticus]